MCGHRSFGLVLFVFLLSAVSGSLAQSAPATAPSAAAPAQAAPAIASPFGEIAGIVKAGTTSLPGVTVTASNSLTGKKYITSTDVDGSYRIEVGNKGRYVVRAEFPAFAPQTQEVVINAENRAAKIDLSMTLLSRVQQQEQQQRAQAAGGRGLQQLALAAGADLGGAGAAGGGADPTSLTGAGLPNAGLAAEGGTESVAVSGTMGRSDQPTFDPGEIQDRIAEMRQNGGNLAFQGGGLGGFGGGGFGVITGRGHWPKSRISASSRSTLTPATVTCVPCMMWGVNVAAWSAQFVPDQAAVPQNHAALPAALARDRGQ